MKQVEGFVLGQRMGFFAVDHIVGDGSHLRDQLGGGHKTLKRAQLHEWALLEDFPREVNGQGCAAGGMGHDCAAVALMCPVVDLVLKTVGRAALPASLLLACASLHAIEPSKVTDFASLEDIAADLALREYQAPSQDLDPFFKELKYDGHRQIRFRRELALFADQGPGFRVEFFHPGWMFQKPVRFWSLGEDGPRAQPFEQKLFDYGQLKLPSSFKAPEGYAGLRLLAPDDLAKRPFEFMVFMGASYFRAVTTELGYGISARGVAVNTLGGKPEEFPDFTHFWIRRPVAGATSMELLALLNGPSVTGAYAFEVQPGRSTSTRVKASLYLRKPVEMLGVAAFSSMFWYGENSHPKPYDFRPEVHDSDGLQIELKSGPSLWRPLDVGREMRLSSFQADGLSGFGLAQRVRDLDHYQDLEAGYHRRPSVWVKPRLGFEKGSVVLVELSTGEETWDNVVAMWRPALLPSSPREPLRVEYDLLWLDGHEPRGLARVAATRRGFVMDSDDHLIVLDYTKQEVEAARLDDGLPKVVVRVNAGEAKVLDARATRQQDGAWRAFFRLDIPASTSLLELDCDLLDKQGKALAERWVYQWRR
jgi:glucans biosynthesis protein